MQREQRSERKHEAADRHPLGEPRAADQPLPLPQDDNRRQPPENREDEAADPRCRQREASHCHRGGDARLEIRPEPSARRRSDRWTLSAYRHAHVLTTPT